MTEQGKLRGEDGRNVARPCREEHAPQPNIITDELWKAFLVEYVNADARMRDALEAVAPMLIAQGMREAAHLYYGSILKRAEQLDPQGTAINKPLDRAQELDPK